MGNNLTIDGQRAAKAVHFLIDSAAEYGAAKANVIRTDNMLRVVKALHMKASNTSGVSAQERDAYASQEYRAALDLNFEAVKTMEILRARREAANATIEFWRSLNANQRSAERGYGSAA